MVKVDWLSHPVARIVCAAVEVTGLLGAGAVTAVFLATAVLSLPVFLAVLGACACVTAAAAILLAISRRIGKRNKNESIIANKEGIESGGENEANINNIKRYINQLANTKKFPNTMLVSEAVQELAGGNLSGEQANKVVNLIDEVIGRKTH